MTRQRADTLASMVEDLDTRLGRQIDGYVIEALKTMRAQLEVMRDSDWLRQHGPTGWPTCIA